MSRLTPALAVLAALATAAAWSPAATGADGADAAAKKKCKGKKTCRTKPKKKAAPLKDGDYTYKQASAGAAPVNTLTISGKGTRIRIRELFFSSGESTAGLRCAATMVDFGTLPLKRQGNLLTWSTGGRGVAVPPIQEQGAGGGTGTTSGQINVKTLEVSVSTNVVMKNALGRGGCLEGHAYEGRQTLRRR